MRLTLGSTQLESMNGAKIDAVSSPRFSQLREVQSSARQELGKIMQFTPIFRRWFTRRRTGHTH